MLGEDSRLGPTPELDHTIVALDRQQLENGQISIIAKQLAQYQNHSAQRAICDSSLFNHRGH